MVYSVANQKSFDRAREIVEEIRWNEAKKTAVILVGNKADLQRTRVVSESGKNLRLLRNQRK